MSCRLPKKRGDQRRHDGDRAHRFMVDVTTSTANASIFRRVASFAAASTQSNPRTTETMHRSVYHPRIAMLRELRDEQGAPEPLFPQPRARNQYGQTCSRRRLTGLAGFRVSCIRADAERCAGHPKMICETCRLSPAAPPRGSRERFEFVFRREASRGTMPRSRRNYFPAHVDSR